MWQYDLITFNAAEIFYLRTRFYTFQITSLYVFTRIKEHFYEEFIFKILDFFLLGRLLAGLLDSFEHMLI